MRSFVVIASALAACGHASAVPSTNLALRPACADAQYWTGSACAPRSDAAAKIEAGAEALSSTADVEAAKAALDSAENAGPLALDQNVRLWEQRGIAAAYVKDEASARTAFDMMLALDPGHFLSYRLSPQATFVFDDMRSATRVSPGLQVDLPRGQKVGDALPLDVEVVADPKKFLDHGTLFVRRRGETAWRAADVPLALGATKRVVLPPIDARQAVSLEVYLRAYDARGNETLAWADPAHPREIQLRYEAPTPWYRKWWVISIAGGVVATATGVIVYEATFAPSEKLTGSGSVGKK